MPELPEVELLRRELNRLTNGKRVDSIKVVSLSALKTFDPPLEAFANKEVKDWTRRGKMLIAEVEGPLYFVIHFSRPGWLKFHEQQPATLPTGKKSTLAARMVFQSGEAIDFTEAGTEKRLALYAVRELEDVARLTQLGIDVLSDEFTFDEFRERLQTSERIKNALVDQHRFAGIGNAYSDEALHMAKISPYATSSKLSDDEMQRLYEAIRVVFNDAIERGSALSIHELKSDKKTNMRVHGKTGESCPVCGDVIREVSFAEKSWQYCATCQTGGKILADRRMSRLLK
jgi:formamidopyrimidine-DNA glycosylase